MKGLYNPIVFIIVMISYSAINIDDIFVNGGTAITLILYVIRSFITIISLTLLMFLFMNKRFEKRYTLITIFIIGYFIILIINSMLNQTINITIIMKYLFALGLYSYILIGTLNINKIIKSFLSFLTVILILNYIFYLFIPEIGVYTENEQGIPLIKGVLTNRNSVIYYSLPLIILLLLEDSFNKIIKWILIILSFISLFLTGSDTAKISAIVLIILLIIYQKKAFNTYLIIILLLIFNVLITFKDIKFIKNSLQNIYNSQSVYSGRDVIWEKTYSLIDFQTFIIGKGLGSEELAESLNYATATNGQLLNDPFHGLLNIMFFNGSIVLIIFLIFFLKIIKNLKNNINTRDNKYFTLYFIIILLIANSESVFQFTNYFFWSMMLIAWAIGKQKNRIKGSELLES